jgi:putative membrane protein
MHRLSWLTAAGFLAIALAGTNPVPLAQAQGTSPAPAQTRTVGPEEFLRLAYSSASLQGQAAKLAASRETRPEVKAFATTAVDYRTQQLQRIEAFARERNLPLPTVKEFEHQVIIENLEPLDYLALSRRYAEMQVQALQQELEIYQAASQSTNQEIKAFASQALPELEQQRAGAQKMYETIRP